MAVRAINGEFVTARSPPNFEKARRKSAPLVVKSKYKILTKHACLPTNQLYSEPRRWQQSPDGAYSSQSKINLSREELQHAPAT